MIYIHRSIHIFPIDQSIVDSSYKIITVYGQLHIRNPMKGKEASSMIVPISTNQLKQKG